MKWKVMKMSANSTFIDVTNHLENKFGPVGSKGWVEAESRAWEEYNAQIIRDARKESGMTQSEVADRIGADKAYISRVEHGITVPTVSSFYRIISAMGMRVVITR